MDTYHTHPIPATVIEPQKTPAISFWFVIVTLLCIALGVFVLLTKMAIIPNYFDIEILNPFVQEEFPKKK